MAGRGAASAAGRRCPMGIGRPPPSSAHASDWSGMTAPMVLDGAMHGAAFLAYVEQVLVPTLTLPWRHRRHGQPARPQVLSPFVDAIEAAGAKLRLPAALQPRLQSHRDGLLQTQGPAPKGRCQNQGRPEHTESDHERSLERRRQLELEDQPLRQIEVATDDHREEQRHEQGNGEDSSGDVASLAHAAPRLPRQTQIGARGRWSRGRR